MAGCTGLIGRRRSRMAGATDYLPQRSQGFFPGSVVPECNSTFCGEAGCY
jgi:hypothetical protein